jgi:hypothetical protein
LADEPETVQLPAGATEKETYVRETLSVGDASVYIYRHESLTSKQVLYLLIESYKAWCMNHARQSPLTAQTASLGAASP